MKNNIQDPLSSLKDIKTIVSIPDYSLYILIAIISIVLIVLFFIVYKYVTRIRKTKQLSAKQIAFNKLKNLDYKNTKDVVYSFTIEGSLFVNEKNKDIFEQIQKELEEFKYKKDVQKLPNNLQNKIKEYIKGIKNGK